MSAITGETGAGKSILLGALGLALGDRANSMLIAPGADRAEVNANFNLSGHPEAIRWLKSKALGTDNYCILRRVISRDGPSRAFINGSSMTVTELRELSEMLLDIHSQHEHQSLLRKENHRRLLDAYGGLQETVKDLEAHYATLAQLRDEIKSLQSNAEEATASFQLLSYQLDELNMLDLGDGELKKLESERKRLEVADENHLHLTEIIRLCSNETDFSASSQISKAISLISNIEDSSLAPIREMLESALIQVDEAMTDIGPKLNLFESDPDRLKAIEHRLSVVYEVARKHRVKPEELPTLKTKIKAKLKVSRDADAMIEQMENELMQAESIYNELAQKLSISRSKISKSLQAAITEKLQALGMKGAIFEIAINRSNSSRFGIDDIEFLISTIPGAEKRGLARIASGGELSRISLAIQVVTAKTSKTPTLVFDEVDVGIGGATAEVVGSLLRELGNHTQVISVTHLPQVASQAHHHYVVIKETSIEGASTNVIHLIEEERVIEIARMLGGLEKTSESLAHAKAMISNKKP